MKVPVFYKLKIFQKFFVTFFLVSFVTVISLSFWFYKTSKIALIDRTFAQLNSVNILKSQQIEKLYHSHKRITLQELNEVMLETTGMGSSGESYLVNAEGYMLSISRFFPKTTSGTIPVKTLSFKKAIQGQSGQHITKDYRNILVFSVYRHLKLNNTDFAMISEIDFEEAIRPVNVLFYNILYASFSVVLLAALASWFLAKLIVRRIYLLQNTVMVLAKGQIPEPFHNIEEQDEIGETMVSVNKLIHSFEKITKVANEIGKGNLNYYFKPLSKEDSLSYSLLKMRQRLSELSVQEKELQRQKTFSLLEGEEKERKRIARELHDSLGQMLNGLRLRLDLIQDSQQKEDLKHIADETLLELKTIIQNLMPTVLADFGLEAGLRNLLENTRKHHPLDIHFTYEKIGVAPVLSFEIAIFLYRIVQEALNNTLKHAQASKMYVSVDKFEDKICVYIKDNGKGFDLSQTHSNHGFGLRNMEERVRSLQGLWEMTSDASGTIINIEIPL